MDFDEVKSIKTDPDRAGGDGGSAMTNCFDFVESKLLPVGGDIKVGVCCVMLCVEIIQIFRIAG